MRAVLAIGLAVVAGGGSAGLAASTGRPISTSGARLVVPTGWHAQVSKTAGCDPERLIVASSARLHINTGGRIAAPRAGEVIVLLMEDRLAQDRPAGDLRRPRHFTIDWSSLRTLEPDGFCGNPRGPAAMHYIKTHGRYLGFIVYPGPHAGAAVRTQTLALMDSLGVSP